MTPTQRKSVLAVLNNGTPMTAWRAGQAIWDAPDPMMLSGIIRTMMHGKSEHNRAEAVYRIQMMPGTAGVAACERILSNKRESKKLRAYAADTLAHRHRPRTHDVVLRIIENDPSAEMRFWCAFALGQMRDKRAVPILERLAKEDRRVVPGWWAVNKEAKASLRFIQQWSRGRRCRFCRQ